MTCCHRPAAYPIFPSLPQEKTKKILDIWLKSNTFPTTVLNGLHKLVKETDKEKEKGAYHVAFVFAKYSSIHAIPHFVPNEKLNVRYELNYKLVCVRTRQSTCCCYSGSSNTCDHINNYATTSAGRHSRRGA